MIQRCLLLRNSWHFCRSEVSDERADSTCLCLMGRGASTLHNSDCNHVYLCGARSFAPALKPDVCSHTVAAQSQRVPCVRVSRVISQWNLWIAIHYNPPVRLAGHAAGSTPILVLPPHHTDPGPGPQNNPACPPDFSASSVLIRLACAETFRRTQSVEAVHNSKLLQQAAAASCRFRGHIC